MNILRSILINHRPTAHVPKALRILFVGIISFTLLHTVHVSAGVYYVQVNAPTQSNVGSNFTVTLTTNVVKDTAATGYVSGKISYPTNLVKLINIYAVDYPSVTAGGADGTITVSSPSKGAGNGYDGRFTIFRATFSAIATGAAQFKSVGGAMYVNGTNHTVISDTISIYAQSCTSGQTGVPPNCVSPSSTPTPSPSPTASATSTPSTSTPQSSPTPTPTTKTQVSSPTSTPKTSTPNPSNASNSSPLVGSGQPTTLSQSGSVTITPESYSATPTSIRVLLRTSASIHDITATYGTTADKTDKELASGFTDGLLAIDAQGLSPSTTYFFTVNANDDQDKTVKYSFAYATDGYPVKIIVTKNGQNLPDTTVFVGDSSFKSDADGIVSLHLVPGSYVLSNEKRDITETIEVTRMPVQEFGEIVSQDFVFALNDTQNTTKTTGSSMKIVGILSAVMLVVLIGGGIGLVAVLRKRQKGEGFDEVPIDGVFNPFDSIDPVTGEYYDVQNQYPTEYPAEELLIDEYQSQDKSTVTMPELPEPTHDHYGMDR